jgi:MFS family permease
VETFSLYAGLAIVFFFLVIFLQQVAGYSPLASGLTTLPVTVVMFALSRRFGALADRFGPRLFMGAGPLVCAGGLLLFQRVGTDVNYLTDLLPCLALFALGLSMTVAPLTAAVLADATEKDAGIASGVNNAIARVAGLIGTAGLGAVVAASFAAELDTRLEGVRVGQAAQGAIAEAKRLPLGLPDVAQLPPGQARSITSAAEQASLHSFHVGMGIAALLLAGGGLIGMLGIRNPRGLVTAEECPGGQLVGTGRELVQRVTDAQAA